MAKKGKSFECGLGKMSRDDIRAMLKTLPADDEEDDFITSVAWDIANRAVNPGEDLAWLAAYDLDPAIAIRAVAALMFATHEDLVPPEICERVMAGARPALLKALQSPGVPDERKAPLGPLYHVCGGNLSPEEYRSFFKDFEALNRRMLDEAVGLVTNSPKSVETIIVQVGGAMEDEASVVEGFLAPMEVAKHSMASKPGATAAILAANLVVHAEEDVPENLQDAAFKEIERTDCPEAVWFLQEMSRWPSLGAIGPKAGRLASKMRLKGHAPRHGAIPPFSHGFISAPDASGSRHLSLMFRTPEGGMDAVMILANIAVGMKDAMCVFEEGAEMEDELRDQLDEVAMAPCSMELAREFLADWWAFHESTGTHFPRNLFIYRPYFGEAPIEPKRRAPNLEAYGLDKMERTPALAASSAWLTEESPYGQFIFCSNEAYDYLAKIAPKKSKRLRKKEFDHFVREIAPLEKERLLALMAQTLEVEALTGYARQEENQEAARVWLHLSENIVPFHEVPFIVALAQESIEGILTNLQMGFANQAEANEAALKMDQFLDDYDNEEDDERDIPF